MRRRGLGWQHCMANEPMSRFNVYINMLSCIAGDPMGSTGTYLRNIIRHLADLDHDNHKGR